MTRASPRDRAYFARIASANEALVEVPPSSLDELFDRMESIRRRLGTLAEPGLFDPNGEGDLGGHLRFLAHVRARTAERGTRNA